MDLTKLSGGDWSQDQSKLKISFGSSSEGAVAAFLRDTNEAKIANSVGDLLQLTRARQARQFVSDSNNNNNNTSSSSSALQDEQQQQGMAYSLSMPALGGVSGGASVAGGSTTGGGGGGGEKKRRGFPSASRRPPPGVSYSIQERPANRIDIANLERELDTRVQAILDLDAPAKYTLTSADLYDPHKDSVTIIRDRLLAEFCADVERLEREPWLDRLIKCECIKITCDEIAIKLVDMLSVSSTQLGTVLRKLRLSYKQSFDQMRRSWQDLRGTFLACEEELMRDKEALSILQVEIGTKEDDVRGSMEQEIERLKQEFEEEKTRDREALAANEYKMEQMADTLQSLNGIFRNMQTDGATIKLSDMNAKCSRLEKDNVELAGKVIALDKTKNDLLLAEERIAALEKEIRGKDMELITLKQQLVRREETVVTLMEREALRNAEIEKMKSMTGVQDEDEDYSLDFKEPATSVLCIKCKKSLDDLSNIRSAVLGKGDSTKIQCESYRILLPNLRGRRPDRSVEWLRNCMRCIFISKMREDVNLLNIRGEASRFPQFVYAWFERDVDWAKGGTAASSQQQSDEDRWGLYYGVKALARENDPEAVVFWSLLDEAHGEDGLQFILHCMSIVLSMGGTELWKQFGQTITAKCANVNVKPADDLPVRTNVWLDIGTAIEALKSILVRALKPHVQEAVEAIYAFRVIPNVADPQVKEEEELERLAEEARLEQERVAEEERLKQEAAEREALGDVDENGNPWPWKAALAGDDEAGMGEGEEGGMRASAAAGSVPAVVTNIDTSKAAAGTAGRGGEDNEKKDEQHVEPTHLNLFMWLRLMLQQIQAEQIHRAAAIRLMFESASVGALTPQLPSASDKDEAGTMGSQVEFPQFQSIARTLFPSINAMDTAMLFAVCHEEGRRKVTGEVLLKVADRRGLFSKAMRLNTLPLLAQNMSLTIMNRAVSASPRPTEVQPLQQGQEEHQQQEGAAAAGEEKQAEAAAVAVAAAAAKDGEKKGENSKPEVPLTKEALLRNRLGALVHRKMQALMPDLMLLSKRLPERWRGLLNDSRDMVLWALNDAHDKSRKARLESANEVKSSNLHFIDGIQPFVYYRRLLSVMLLVKALSDNPLLPSELFLGKDRNVAAGITMDIGLRQVENLLTALEVSVVTSIRLDSSAGVPGGAAASSTTAGMSNTVSHALGLAMFGPKGASKVFRFEATRINLVARRLQAVAKAFVNDASLAVPRSVRMCMRAGYVRGTRNTKTREVLREPWWAQAHIAEVYAYKLRYDSKASRVGGMASLPLHEAVMASFFARFGSMEVAEREVHDLFVCVATHAYGDARLRLFAAFLGLTNVCNHEDLPGDPLGSLLQTQLAVSVYLNLLTEVHREVAAQQAQKEEQEQQQKLQVQSGGVQQQQQQQQQQGEVPVVAPVTTAAAALAPRAGGSSAPPTAGSMMVIGSLPVAVAAPAASAPLPAASTSSDEQAQPPQVGTTLTSAPLLIARISSLFPSSISAFAREDKRDVWRIDGTLLVQAVRRWTCSLKGLDEETRSAFCDLAEVLKASVGVEVDAFLFVMMAQWAKFLAWYVKKASSRAAWSEKNAPHAKQRQYALLLKKQALAASISGAATTGAASTPTTAVAVTTSTKETAPPPLSGSFVRALVESLYKAPASDSLQIADPIYYHARFTRSFAKGTAQAYKDSHLDKMLLECSLWDANTGAPSSLEGEGGGEGNGSTSPASVAFVQEVSSACSLEFSFEAARLCLGAYNAPVTAQLDRISEGLKKAHNVEAEKCVAACRSMLATLVDLAKVTRTSADAIGGGDGGGKKKAKSSSLSLLTKDQASVQMWNNLSMLFALVEDTMISTDEPGPFPLDAWRLGSIDKLPLLATPTCYQTKLKNYVA